MSENNGKNGYRTAFWVLGALFTIMFTILIPMGSNAIIANDRLRATEDQRIEKDVKETQDIMHSIDKRLARIEVKLEIKGALPELQR